MPDIDEVDADLLLRIAFARPGEPEGRQVVEEVAAVYCDGRIVINWPLVEELAAKPLPTKAQGLQSIDALARILQAARQA